MCVCPPSFLFLFLSWVFLTNTFVQICEKIVIFFVDKKLFKRDDGFVCGGNEDKKGAKGHSNSSSSSNTNTGQRNHPLTTTPMLHPHHTMHCHIAHSSFFFSFFSA